MFYIRGDNTLECEALNVFNQLTAPPDSANTTVLVQLARIGSPCDGVARWDGIRRFVIKHGMPVDSVDATVVNATNMGDRSTLEDFVRWGTEVSHREHTMLIMWGHGDGTTLW